MNGLIKLPKPADVGAFGMLSVALFSVSAFIYVLASGFIGSGAA